MIDSIRRAAEGAGDYPLRGRLQQDGSRKIVSLPYGYLVYYVFNAADTTIDILTVQHPAKRRNPDDAEGRCKTEQSGDRRDACNLI